MVHLQLIGSFIIANHNLLNTNQCPRVPFEKGYAYKLIKVYLNFKLSLGYASKYSNSLHVQ